MRSVSSLRVLAALDGADSFSAAADRLGMSQSAVSQHVAALEQQVGLPLVQRGTRPVDVTVAGRVLAGHATAVLARLEAAGLDLEELAGHHHRRLRVGGFPTALATFVPRALALLAIQSPDVTFTVVDDHLQGLVPRLLNRELDVALVFDDSVERRLPGLDDGVELTSLFLDPYRLLVPRSHRLAARKGALSLADLDQETWVGGGSASTWFQIVRGRCRAVGFEPRVGIASDDYLAVQAFVAAGLGIAVVPGLVASRRIAGVEVRMLQDPAPTREVMVACPVDPFRPAAATTMVALLRRVTAGRSSPG
ncbi:LysR family transcriptional regulator [Aeromicrobium choanae]|uniref:DNA-binding transcriptional regulator, LysR family n=1 Tax=Aeromicrobium choanae TaxID=1736691 RepID=A0A1T4Z4Y2_9ACTN|nr:LysR family transcriptional regulator [Aeromicrobium choanae]SKB09112.1 DNA-binding transcriptional regulator, LysR family [Aeromicrobium choanae]